jgi:hypothetical protein
MSSCVSLPAGFSANRAAAFKKNRGTRGFATWSLLPGIWLVLGLIEFFVEITPGGAFGILVIAGAGAA